MFSDTFAGIAGCAPMFVVFQILGAAPGAGLVAFLYPDIRADAVVVPHADQASAVDDHRNHTVPNVERTTTR
jgi:hypothetical protein